MSCRCSTGKPMSSATPPGSSRTRAGRAGRSCSPALTAPIRGLSPSGPSRSPFPWRSARSAGESLEGGLFELPGLRSRRSWSVITSRVSSSSSRSSSGNSRALGRNLCLEFSDTLNVARVPVRHDFRTSQVAVHVTCLPQRRGVLPPALYPGEADAHVHFPPPRRSRDDLEGLEGLGRRVAIHKLVASARDSIRARGPILVRVRPPGLLLDQGFDALQVGQLHGRRHG